MVGVVRSTIDVRSPPGSAPNVPPYVVPSRAGAERVGHRVGGEAHQQRSLEAGGHLAGQAASADLEARGVTEQRQGGVGRGVQAGVHPAGHARPR